MHVTKHASPAQSQIKLSMQLFATVLLLFFSIYMSRQIFDQFELHGSQIKNIMIAIKAYNYRSESIIYHGIFIR